MPRVAWPLSRGRPVVEIQLTSRAGQPETRRLLADTGAGRAGGLFDLILLERDCLQCGGFAVRTVSLGGTYSGRYTAYLIRVHLPALRFQAGLVAIGVPSVAPGLDGIAGFRFLNRFTYGNFGDPARFGLET